MKLIYYFSPMSAFAFLGHKKIINLRKKFNLDLSIKPIDLSYVLNKTGGVPLKLRHLSRKNYRILEMKRFSLINKVKINLAPKYFPPKDVNLVSQIIISCDLLKIKKDIVLFFFQNLWQNNIDICDLKIFENYCKKNYLNFKKIIEIAHHKNTKKILLENTIEAINKGVFGSPTYYFQGKIYWGQDRIFILKKNINSEFFKK